MSQQYKLTSSPLIGPIFLCLLTGICLFIWMWFTKPDPEPATTKHSVKTPSEDVLKYWTADKMRKARPAPLPHINTPGRKKRQPQSPPDAPSPRNT